MVLRPKLPRDLNIDAALAVPRDLVDRLNAEYVSWDQLRRKDLPRGVSTQGAWSALWLMRRGAAQGLPLEDRTGEPFWMCVLPRAQEMLHRIDKEIGAILSGDDDPRARRQRRLLDALIDEAIASSQIEGAATTRKVARAMLREGRGPKTHGERMIANNYRTIQWCREHAMEPLTVSRIREIHRLLCTDTLPDADLARLRRDDDQVRVVDDRGEVVHVPPPAAELDYRLKALCTFANAKTTDQPFLHPVLRAIVVHFWLAYDHPFVDGNGRTARALFFYTMLRHEYSLFEYLSISSVVAKARRRYYQAFLDCEDGDRDVTYFVVYHLDAILRAGRELADYFARKTRDAAAIEPSRLPDGISIRERELLILAAKDPSMTFTVKTHARLSGVTPPTARADLHHLVELGFLRKLHGGKEAVFQPTTKARDLLR